MPWNLHNSIRAAAAFTMLLPGANLAAQDVDVERKVNNGTAQSVSPQRLTVPQEKEPQKVEPTHVFEFADHVANGIAMRNRTAGTIHLRGAPVPSKVLRALLYFNFSDDLDEGVPTVPVLFNNTRVMAEKTGDHDDPCWGMTGNHSYVANVTRLVPIGGHLNQDYDVVIQFGAGTLTSGENPWTSSSLDQEKLKIEGATLVIVYRTEATTGSVFVYDDLNDDMFMGTAQFDLLHANLNAAGRFTMIGADGQRGISGYDNIASNELTFFNSTQIAGPPIASSDWDGSDGWPLVQLWDTHTHNVELQGNSSEVVYQSSGDCLVPVAFVIDED